MLLTPKCNIHTRRICAETAAARIRKSRPAPPRPAPPSDSRSAMEDSRSNHGIGFQSCGRLSIPTPPEGNIVHDCRCVHSGQAHFTCGLSMESAALAVPARGDRRRLHRGYLRAPSSCSRWGEGHISPVFLQDGARQSRPGLRPDSKRTCAAEALRLLASKRCLVGSWMPTTVAHVASSPRPQQASPIRGDFLHDDVQSSRVKITKSAQQMGKRPCDYVIKGRGRTTYCETMKAARGAHHLRCVAQGLRHSRNLKRHEATP